MSTLTIRAFSLGKKSSKIRFKLPLIQEHPVTGLFIFLVLISSLALIYTKDLNRRLFIQYQNLEQAYAQKKIEQKQLILERSTWATQDRIQMLASEKLGMRLPSHQQTIVIKARVRSNYLTHVSNYSNEKQPAS